MSICAGTLDAPTGLAPKAHIYLGSKGDYYEVPEDGLLRRKSSSAEERFQLATTFSGSGRRCAPIPPP